MRNVSHSRNTKLKYFAIYKPDGMLSQFTSEGGKNCLADLDYPFPKDVYPVGRLDELSEGLLLLTNDKRVNHLLLDPKHGHERVYQACVSGKVNQPALNQLEIGVEIKAKKTKHFVKAKSAKSIEAPNYPNRRVSFSYSKEKGLSWLELILTGGKNRQVRKMTAAVGFPTLRLIRTSIEQITLGEMQPEDVIEFDAKQFYKLLKIER
jgi:23S rRNA pseudouridine2457 synthase